MRKTENILVTDGILTSEPLLTKRESTVASKGHTLFSLLFFHLRLSCYFLAT